METPSSKGFRYPFTALLPICAVLVALFSAQAGGCRPNGDSGQISETVPKRKAGEIDVYGENEQISDTIAEEKAGEPDVRRDGERILDTAAKQKPGKPDADGVVRPQFAADPTYDRKRAAMVRYQILDRGVKDVRVLNAMLKVPRHEFVPENVRHLSYEDYPLPIGEDQTISQPYMVAFMTEALKLKGGERVLEIGTGSGYQAAILAELCPEVYTIEIIKVLADRSAQLLKRLGYQNIFVKWGDGFRGWKEHAPFDAIIVTCAPEEVPPPLIEQLAPGGRLVCPVGPQWRWQKLVRLTKQADGTVVQEELLDCRFVPMTGEAERK